MGSNYIVGLLVALSCLVASCVASAAPPVYRCETNGSVAYSDLPCVGAKVIDATPNQGVDKMSGQSRKGADVRRAETDNAFDDALKSLTGEVARRDGGATPSSTVSSQDQAECARLDRQLSVLEGGGVNLDAKVGQRQKYGYNKLARDFSILSAELVRKYSLALTFNLA